MASLGQVFGVAWGDGVIGNAKWGGVRLCEVLAHVGVEAYENGHVCFASYVSRCQDDEFYGASIPLTKAMSQDDDVLLAFEASLVFTSRFRGVALDVQLVDER